MVQLSKLWLKFCQPLKLNLVGVAVPSSCHCILRGNPCKGDLSLDYVRLPAEKMPTLHDSATFPESKNHVQIPNLSLKREWLVVFSDPFRRFQLLVLRGNSSSFSIIIHYYYYHHHHHHLHLNHLICCISP